MKATRVLVISSVTGLAGSIIGSTVFTISALACHPKGVIQKSVINQTTGSILSDANTDDTAVDAKPGDVLKYVIEIRNEASDGNNDMFYTVLKDTLPSGVELVESPSEREISEDLGTIKPGEKIVKEYTVKVTAAKDMIINNEACFTGDTEAKDSPQKGCDNAKVKITIPEVVVDEEPEAETTETTPAQETSPVTESLPSTGASAIFAPLAATVSGGLAYVGRLVHIKRRQG